MKTSVCLLTLIASYVHAKRPQILTVSQKNPSIELKDNFKTNQFDNFFEIQFLDDNLIDDKHLIILFYSQSTNFELKFQHPSKDLNGPKLVVSTLTGNSALVVTKALFNSKLSFIKEEGILQFKVANGEKDDPAPQDYRIKVFFSDKLQIEHGLQFTVRLDPSLTELKVESSYDGTLFPNLKKLRFQVTSVVQKPDYVLKSTLSYRSSEFIMNHIFKKTVGGILSLPSLPVCKEHSCIYTMNLKVERVRSLSVETFFIEDIETLDINHFEGYYDKAYESNQQLYYKLPYSPEREGLDVSVTLIPVNSSVSLYINPQSKPTAIDNYTWIEKGDSAKKITVKWEEIQQM